MLRTSEFADFAYENFEPVLIDVSKRPLGSTPNQASYEEVRRKYGVVSFPTVVVVGGSSSVNHRIAGYDRKGAHVYVRNLTEKLSSFLVEN